MENLSHGWQVMIAKRKAALFLCCTIALVLAGCRNATPEQVGQGVAGFAGDVLYNSAGSETQANRENAYPQPCHQCEGLGYHASPVNADERTECYACRGKGWN